MIWVANSISEILEVFQHFLKKTSSIYALPSLHTQFWWQLMKFNSFETHRPDFVFRKLFLFLAHECVWQFRGHTPVRSTGKSVWIKMFQIIWLYWSVLQWRTSSLRNLASITSLYCFQRVSWTGMHMEISLSLGLLVTARLNWIVWFGLLLLFCFGCFFVLIVCVFFFFWLRNDTELHRKQFWLNWLSEFCLALCVLWKYYFVWPLLFFRFQTLLCCGSRLNGSFVVSQILGIERPLKKCCFFFTYNTI